MKKRVLIGILTGAIAVSVLFAGCAQANTGSESKTSAANATTATAKSTEKATTSATEKTTASEKSTESVTEQTTVKEDTTEFTVEETTTAATEVPTNASEEVPAEEATRTDGSILTKTEYSDKIWGMTMTFPESWQNNNIYVLNNNGSDGRSLTFVEKTNYDSDKKLGLIFKLKATSEPIEETNNDKNLGSFTDENGNTLYISVFTPSDVRANLLDETLTENYRKVFAQKDAALSSITFEN